MAKRRAVKRAPTKRLAIKRVPLSASESEEAPLAQRVAKGISADTQRPWVTMLPASSESSGQCKSLKRVRVSKLSEIADCPKFQRRLDAANKKLQELLPAWKRREGFNGASVGYRLNKDGTPTGEVCIRVFVNQTIPADKLKKNRAFPDFVGRVKVQVVTGCFRHAAGGGATPGSTEALDGGDAVIPKHQPNTKGTVGVVARDKNLGNSRYLTAAHVVLADVRPADIGGINNRSILNDAQEEVGTFLQSRLKYGGTVDCALVVPISPIPSAHLLTIKGFNGYPVGIRTSKIAIGERVRMYSRRLDKVTGGTITDLHFSAPMTNGVTLKDQILIKPDAADGLFGQGGDSGSVVIDDTGEAIGLFVAVMVDIAGNAVPDGFVIACRFADVSSELNIDLFPISAPS